MNHVHKFSREFLISLSKWQKGWAENQDKRRQIADELVRQCEQIPNRYKTYYRACYRKRFIVNGEMAPILLYDNFFEGIASWTSDLDYAKRFKGIDRPSSKFVVIFKKKPRPQEIILNIQSLWNDPDFKNAVQEFEMDDSDAAKALLNFKDLQSEIILRSTLKGSEIIDIVGESSSFEVLCDMARIPEEKREEFSIKYAKDPNNLLIELPTFAGKRPTKQAIKSTLIRLRHAINTAKSNNVWLDWSGAATSHTDDLKHKL